jgi:hypothetical protein
MRGRQFAAGSWKRPQGLRPGLILRPLRGAESAALPRHWTHHSPGAFRGTPHHLQVPLKACLSSQKPSLASSKRRKCEYHSNLMWLTRVPTINLIWVTKHSSSVPTKRRLAP